MIPGLLSHSVQSTVFAGAAWLLAVGLRKNRARVRFWIYFTASMKFLVPFAALISLGTLLPKPPVSKSVPAEWADMIYQFVEPFVVPGSAPKPDLQLFNWQAAVISLWFCGFAAISMCWIARWRRMRALCNLALAVEIAQEFPIPIKSTARLMEPGVFGIFRQVFLLPEGIVERLSAEELGAVLAHELCHVKRRDNLTAALHMAVQAIFWFHPIVWWLGARMVDERERACDEEVLRLGNRPQAYAAGILNVCRHYVSAPLACVSGVTGSNLRRRIEAILEVRHQRALGYPKIAALALAAVTAIALPLSIGIVHPRPMRAQSAAPQFEVASVKASKGGPEGVWNEGSHERLRMLNMTLKAIIAESYGVKDHDVFGPAWIEAERFEIIAKISPDTAKLKDKERYASMQAMAQNLLTDRFKLKLHRETRQMPVYVLTPVKGGLKIIQTGPLSSDWVRATIGRGKLKAQQMPMEQLLSILGGILDREVLNETGVRGVFDINLEWAPDETSAVQEKPSLFTALQEQAGLKLEARKVAMEVLVVDHAERPTEN